jgi:hypothetical protein
MAEVFHLTFDTDLSEFGSYEDDGGDLSVSTAAAMVGAKGLQAFIDDTTRIYGAVYFSKATKYRARFYFDINSLSMSTGDIFDIARWAQDGGGYTQMFRFLVEKLAGSYKIWTIFLDDDDNATEDSATLTDAPHYLEIYFTRAVTSSSSDGTFEWWIDGVSQGAVSSIDNYNLMSDYDWMASLGAFYVVATMSGTLFFDDFIANDDGTAIGSAFGARPNNRPLGMDLGSRKRVTITL